LYEKGASFNRVAKLLQISKNTVAKYARIEGWSAAKLAEEEDDEWSDQSDQGGQTVDPGHAISVLQQGESTLKSLVKEHQAEWNEIERLRVDALRCYQDETFRPEDAPDTWGGSKDRLTYAGKLFSMYNTAANALMVAQEGERRAHGFDYRDQKKAAKEEGKDYARQADALRSMMTSVYALARMKDAIDGEWHEPESEDQAASEGAHETDGAGASEDHSPSGQTLEAQLEQLKAAGATKIFREKASGARTDRAELARLLRCLSPDDMVLVTRLDRLARSTRDLLNTLAGIADTGAGFRSLADAWADTTTPHGRLMLAVMGDLAEFERDLIRARTGEGRARAKARGVRLGRRPKLTPHQVREALARRAGGEPLTDIARSYNVSHSTISRLQSRTR
jgi:DNA invertase Pin-like site-specific DNA recombinase